MNEIYFHLEDHIYCCAFKEDIILLDLIKDQYSILPSPHSLLFKFILNNSFEKRVGMYKSNHDKHSEIEINEMLLHLREAKIISKNDWSSPSKRFILESSEGASNIDWRLTKRKTKLSPIRFIRSYYKIILVFLTLKFKGLNYLIGKIKHNLVNPKETQNSNKQEWDLLVDNLNYACLLFPFNIKCLIWSACLALLARDRGLRCQFVMGVQNYPFMAHAWVQDDENRVIADSETLSSDLAVILKEPCIVRG